jgi:hypothetical protein
MADLVAANLTYTALEPVNGEIMNGGKRRRVFAITTAAGEYPTGGLPLDNSLMGMPSSVESIKVLEASAADNFQYVWDKSANKIKVIVDDGTTGVPAEHANATFTSPDQLVIEVIGW